MEISLKLQDWSATDRYATAFESFTRQEPLPWAEFFITRGRALAECGRGRPEPELAAEIQRLIEEAERVKLRIALPELLEAQAGLEKQRRMNH